MKRKLEKRLILGEERYFKKCFKFCRSISKLHSFKKRKDRNGLSIIKAHLRMLIMIHQEKVFSILAT